MKALLSVKHLRRTTISLGAAALSILGFAGSGLAADAITGTWMGSGGQFRERLHTIVENGASVEIRAAENYAFPDAAACRVSNNQLLGKFEFTGTDRDGYRRYEGQWIGWTISNGVCTISAPSGQFTASLRPGADPFQRPPLEYGPDNMINIYVGSSPVTTGLPFSANWGFYRKSGTSNVPPSTGGGSNPPQTPVSHAPIVVPGETGTLAGAGTYTLIGLSSNRPGARAGYLYLGDGRASATYVVQAPAAGKYALWIRFDDDGQHAAGARGVEISVNATLAIRWNNESRDTKGWVNIPAGFVDLRAGTNTIVFTKAATTSAAFVLDEFMLSDQPGFIPQ